VRIWYRVRDLELARAFYTEVLGFTERHVDDEDWLALDRGATAIALSQGEPLDEEGGVVSIDVEDVRAERERLESAGVQVGTPLEVHGEVRVLDVFDPDGNRIRLAEEVA
jgi:catechol 2,3-dioxygenase-like lactoylglutathione lyase family enzyme